MEVGVAACSYASQNSHIRAQTKAGINAEPLRCSGQKRLLTITWTFLDPTVGKQYNKPTSLAAHCFVREEEEKKKKLARGRYRSPHPCSHAHLGGLRKHHRCFVQPLQFRLCTAFLNYGRTSPKQVRGFGAWDLPSCSVFQS